MRFTFERGLSEKEHNYAIGKVWIPDILYIAFSFSAKYEMND